MMEEHPSPLFPRPLLRVVSFVLALCMLVGVPSRAAKNRFIERMLSQALLSGAEIAAMSAGSGVLSPLKLEGVDDPLLYFANVQAFGDLVKVGPQAAREWRDLRDLLRPGASP